MDNLRKVNARSILLLCHRNADPDTLCSAYALFNLLKKIKPSLMINIGAPQGLSKLSKKILKYLPFDFVYGYILQS